MADPEPVPRPSAGGESDGVVGEWHAAEGWGLLLLPELSSPVWAHYSTIAMSGYRALVPGQRVRVTWERFAQDGHRYRAVAVVPESGAADVDRSEGAPRSAAMRSALTLRDTGDGPTDAPDAPPS